MKIGFHMLAIAVLLGLSGCKSTSVDPASQTISTVTISGNVNSPGRYKITEDTSLLEALEMAGGIKFMGGGPQVWMTRGEARFQFNVEEMLNQDIPFLLVSGDSITIPHQGCFGGMTENEINIMNKQIEEKIQPIK
jgi:protein involved in polysaccharide export with SLBB domain